MQISNLSRIGLINILGVLQLTVLRTYFVIFLEEDLLTEILIISALLTIQNTSQIFFRIPLSKMSQIVGRKPIILFGTSCFTFALFFLAIADHWIYALFTVIFISIGMSAYWPAIFASIGDIADGQNMGRMNGKIFQMGDFGQLSAAALASYFLRPNLLVGQLRLIDLYRGFLIISVFANLMAFIILKESLLEKDRLVVASKSREFLKSLKQLFSDFVEVSRIPGLFPIYLMQFFIAFVEFGFGAFYPSLLSKYGYLDSEIANLLTISTLVLLIFKPRIGNLSDKFGYRRPVILGFIIISISIFIMSVLDTFWVLICLVTIIIGVFVLHYAAMNSHTAATAPNDKRGIAMGTLGVYTSLGRGLSTMMIGWIASLSDIFTAFSVFAGFTFVVGFGFVLLSNE
ncbi:MAG: MFS transporter [Candidatus Heimdallarchaeota archaeon]|nr:MFS transporter [Candidatus Heimdallarchaeota archaeon]